MSAPNILELRHFYKTVLGGVVCRILRERIRTFWPDLHKAPENFATEVVLGLGHTTHYLLPFLKKGDVDERGPTVVAAMHAARGATHWPNMGKNLTLLVDDTDLPFADSSVNYMMMVHSLEHAHELLALREAWRVLTPGGKLLVIVPNRRGLWSRAESTPFGYGRPFSEPQLKRLMEDSMFSVTRLETALFLLPVHSRWLLSFGGTLFEKIGRRFLRRLGGVIILEAEKTMYAAHALPVRQKQRVLYVPAMPALRRVSANTPCSANKLANGFETSAPEAPTNRASFT